MEISSQATVASVKASRRSRRHRTDTYILIEAEIDKIIIDGTFAVPICS